MGGDTLMAWVKVTRWFIECTVCEWSKHFREKQFANIPTQCPRCNSKVKVTEYSTDLQITKVGDL